MPDRVPDAPATTARCCSAEHVGPRVLPLSAFYGLNNRKPGGSDYCRECYREWRRRKRAKERGEVAADVGPDYTAIAEAQLYPGRAYADLTPAERWQAIELARSLATAAGVYPPAPVEEGARHG
jgi:hypothetical protein